MFWPRFVTSRMQARNAERRYEARSCLHKPKETIPDYRKEGKKRILSCKNVDSNHWFSHQLISSTECAGCRRQCYVNPSSWDLNWRWVDGEVGRAIDASNCGRQFCTLDLQVGTTWRHCLTSKFHIFRSYSRAGNYNRRGAARKFLPLAPLTVTHR
jgi:hypothetical protein